MRPNTRSKTSAGLRRTIAIKLIEELQEKGLNLTQISQRIKIGNNTISRWYNGVNPSPRMISKLQGLKTKIEQEDKEKILANQHEIWESKGGMERLSKWYDWKDKNINKCRTDWHDKDEHLEALEHYKKELKHRAAFDSIKRDWIADMDYE